MKEVTCCGGVIRFLKIYWEVPRSPHSVLFRVRICLFPPFESTPLSPDWQNFWTPLSRLFAGFSCLGDSPKSKTLLNIPPIFYFITPFFNFSGFQRVRERKTTPFLKEISGWKVKYPPFLQFSGRTLSHEKYPFTGDFGNTYAVPPTPEWGGGAGEVPSPFRSFAQNYNYKSNESSLTYLSLHESVL